LTLRASPTAMSPSVRVTTPARAWTSPGWKVASPSVDCSRDLPKSSLPVRPSATAGSGFVGFATCPFELAL